MLDIGVSFRRSTTVRHLARNEGFKVRRTRVRANNNTLAGVCQSRLGFEVLDADPIGDETIFSSSCSAPAWNPDNHPPSARCMGELGEYGGRPVLVPSPDPDDPNTLEY